jgi:tRNA-dihydrouridine synthase B
MTRRRDVLATGLLLPLAPLPVLANGDIDSPEKAAYVLRHTGADAVMVGRAAQGRPWIFREIAHFLATGEHLPEPTIAEVSAVLLEHLAQLHAFYGEQSGVRIARKHLGWYAKDRPENAAFRAVVKRKALGCVSRSGFSTRSIRIYAS